MLHTGLMPASGPSRHLAASRSFAFEGVVVPGARTPRSPSESPARRAAGRRLRPARTYLERVPRRLGEVLCEPGVQLRDGHLSANATVSPLYARENGTSAAIAIVAANEGIPGVSPSKGGGTAPSRATVQSARHGYGFRARLLKNAFDALLPGEARQPSLPHRGPATGRRMLVCDSAQTAPCLPP